MTHCNRCTREGYREVAVHREGPDGARVIEVLAAACSCARGAALSQRGVVPSLVDVQGQLHQSPSTLAIYLDPTAAQRGEVSRGPAPEVTRTAYLREVLGAQTTARYAHWTERD